MVYLQKHNDQEVRGELGEAFLVIILLCHIRVILFDEFITGMLDSDIGFSIISKYSCLLNSEFLS